MIHFWSIIIFDLSQSLFATSIDFLKFEEGLEQVVQNLYQTDFDVLGYDPEDNSVFDMSQVVLI